jgi:hypothetical protein
LQLGVLPMKPYSIRKSLLFGYIFSLRLHGGGHKSGAHWTPLEFESTKWRVPLPDQPIQREGYEFI